MKLPGEPVSNLGTFASDSRVTVKIFRRIFKMTSKFFLYLVLPVLLTGGITLAQEPPTPPVPMLPPAPPGPFALLIEGGSFLGVYAEDVSKENMSRYGLREVRGIGLTGIVKGSPAEKGGLKKDDVILRFDNETVTSVRKLNRLVGEVAPDHSVRLIISRNGAEQEVAVTIDRRSDFSDTTPALMPPGSRVWRWEGTEPGKDGFEFAFGNSRRIGVSTMELTKQLADFFGIADGKGLLVTSVVEDSPAAKAGIKAGDIITAIDGEKVDDAGDLARAINKSKEGEVTLTIMRDKSQHTIKVTPKEGGFPFGQPAGKPKMGRRVVIPRIELPSIPEMNIVVPQIELPTIPEIDVVIPQRAPKARVKKLPAPQPI
jgi:serine protease Do